MSNIHPDQYINTIKHQNEQLLNQEGQVIWFTGLSGSGKTTIAKTLYEALNRSGYLATILDGDNVRTGLCKDLTFSEEDRLENIRRIAHVAKLMADNGLIVLASFISPKESMRALAAEIIGEDRFSLIHVATDLEVCKERDPKGLYDKAIKGEIKNFTGISDAYEEPEVPTMIVDTAGVEVKEIVKEMMEMLITFQDEDN